MIPKTPNSARHLDAAHVLAAVEARDNRRAQAATRALRWRVFIMAGAQINRTVGTQTSLRLASTKTVCQELRLPWVSGGGDLIDAAGDAHRDGPRGGAHVGEAQRDQHLRVGRGRDGA
jgi:hypothetical protein